MSRLPSSCRRLLAPCAAVLLSAAGCVTPGGQDMAATRAAWGAGSASAMAARIRDDQPLRLGSVSLPAPVAYEWLAAHFMREGHPDDAVLAICMAALLDVESKDVPDNSLPLALFEYARELRSSQALQDSLAERRGGEQKELTIQDIVTAISQASEHALRSSDPAFEARVTKAWRDRLTPKPPDDGKKPTPKYVSGDAAFISAFALSLLQREEDLPYIERLLATDSVFPVLQPYLRAIVKKNPAVADRLLAHPSAAVRANALVALKRPAPEQERHPLVRVAGAMNPADGGEAGALALLEAGLTNDTHMVRVLAMVGLTALRHEVPREVVGEAIRTSDAWRKRHVFMHGHGIGNTMSFMMSAMTQTNAYEDGQLPRYGYTLFGAAPERSEDDVRWLLGQVRQNPPFMRDIAWTKDMDGPDGYVQETSENASADRLNSILANSLATYAVAHPGPILAALEEANPYTRPFLISALAPAAASNATVRSALWAIAEGGAPADSRADDAFIKQQQDRLAAEVQKTLSYNQVVNRSAVDRAVLDAIGRLRVQARRSAVAALAGAEKDDDRMAALLRSPNVARAVVPYFLQRGAAGIERHVPADLLGHRSAEVRMAAALLRLSVADEPAARQALASAIGDPELAEFAARFALASSQPAVREVVLGARSVKPLTVTGHLIRRLEIRGARAAQADAAAAPARATAPAPATPAAAAKPKPAAKPRPAPAAPAADQPVGR